MIGGGFAGLWAVRALRRAPADILLVDQHNHHTFQPLLYQVATAGLASPSIAAPLRHILRRQANVTVRLGEVTRIDPASRQVFIGDAAVSYDYLLLATGVSHAYFGHDDWAPFAPGLKTLDDALRIRGRILNAFECAEASSDPEEVRAQLTFVIVGGGPTGVELAGTLAEIARHTLTGEFRRIDPASARVVLVEAGARVLPAFPEALSASAKRQLAKLGVTVLTGRAITGVDASGVNMGEERLATRTVLWAAGVTASPLARSLGVPLDRNGRVQVAQDLSVPGHPEIFVAGDLAAVTAPEGPVPGIAPAAKQMGNHVARTLCARLAGKPAPPFRYRHHGLLATIGRMAAVVDMGRLRFSGVLAWWFWLAAHIYFLIGFRNRLVVLIDWAGAYWTYQRGARIVTGKAGADQTH
ncbi:MAG TPA: NAD(P)/FAD-dependent oxidoreductase [Steroidobacteraceae bacterium]|nr:NAD(P)/FAD-dependent oxidoreductase [Steroidobacteraceae bacterium]